jgi:hypothetical protein
LVLTSATATPEGKEFLRVEKHARLINELQINQSADVVIGGDS